METKEFSLKPEKQKNRGNWKGKLAAALAGVLGASVIGPAITSFMPDTANAAQSVDFKESNPGYLTANDWEYGGSNNNYLVVRTQAQLEYALTKATSDKELVIHLKNTSTKVYSDGKYDKSGNAGYFPLNKTIVIPEGKNVKFVADEDVVFVRDKDFSGTGPLFEVKGSGTKLTVGNHIVMTGQQASYTSETEKQNTGVCLERNERKWVVDVPGTQKWKWDGTYWVEKVDKVYDMGAVADGIGYLIYDKATKKYLSRNYSNGAEAMWFNYNQIVYNPSGTVSESNPQQFHAPAFWANIEPKSGCGFTIIGPATGFSNGNPIVVLNKGTYNGSVANATVEIVAASYYASGDVRWMVKPGTTTELASKYNYKGPSAGNVNELNGKYEIHRVRKSMTSYMEGEVGHWEGDDECTKWEEINVAYKSYSTTLTNKTWTRDNVADNSGYFVYQAGGEVVVDGATFKDFSTISGEGTYQQQPLGSAPIYVANGKFTMNSGNIVNNTVGYTIGDDEYSGKEAQDIKNHVQTKPETYTAGAIIFTGGSDHQLNGGLIAGNKADAGAIIVKTKNNHPFASNSSFSGHNDLATWAASADASSTKVTMGAGTSAGPVIAGNVGIHDSGAVFVWPVGDKDTAEVVMNAGKVQDNFSWYKGGAFNVCSEIDPIEHWKQDKKRANAKAILDMNGGLIENNTAVCRGGAIEVVSDQVYLKAGIIRDNNSRTLGGAIYVEGDFADRLYTLYLPNTYVNNNNAWKETKAGQEASDYAYLKRKLVSGNRARLNADGTYTYDNPLGNVRNDNGSINDTDSNEGKKDWSPVSDGAKKWILSATRTGDWRDFAHHSGIGGGLWLCALGGYASINFFNDTNNPKLVGAYIDGNHGTKGSGMIDWDMTALAKDGGFTLSKATTTAQDQSEYVYLDNQNNHLVWNKLYSGRGSRYDIVNSNNITTDNTQGGTKGVLITQNNARAGGGIASNGTVIFGESGDIYRHSAETTFTKTWTGVTSKPMAFQAYIIKSDGTKVAIPGYQFILDGTAGDAQGGNGSIQSIVDETSAWTAKIQLPYGYDGTPTFSMTANGKTYDTLMSLWDIPGSVTSGTVKDWNFAVEEIPSLPHKKTGLTTSNKYYLIKKVDGTSGSESDRDPNFKAGGTYTAPIDLGAQTGAPYRSFPSKYESGLYFVREYINVTEINETLFNGEYAIIQENGTVIEEFTISEGETEFASYNLVEKPSTVKLSQTVKEIDYKDKAGNIITKIKEYSTKAYTEGDGNNLKMGNTKREEPGVEKYINKKVDQDLDNIGQQFTYDIIAKVPDQAEEFAISDTLVDWIEYVGGTEAIQIKVLDNNDHLGNGSGTVATGKVNNTGNSVVNQALTSQVNAACEKIILNDTLTVRVTDKTVLKNLIGKYVQITINAQLDSKHYDDVMGKVASSDRQVTYNDNTVAYALKNDFDKENYTYRLYKVSDTATDGLVAIGSQKAGDFLTESEVKALGISADTKLVRSGRLAIDGSVQASFDPSKKAFTTLSAGKYVLHVMEGKIDDGSNGQTSRDKAVLKRCEVFEIIDGDEDIRWVSVAGTSQNGLPEAFKNDSPYMGEGKQQTDPQVVTGNTAEDKRKDTSDDPLHDGVGNRATFAVTYRGGRQQTLKSNTVTVEPLPETPKIEKYVNKKVDDTLAGFDSNFTYDIMAYIPNGVSTVVIDDTLVDWLEFASTENTLSQIRVLSDNDHLGTGAGTVATGSVNGNSKVVDVALDNKYTVEKTGNRLKVTVNDRDTITQLWGNWVQVTFDAKIKESAYGAVVSKLNEKTDENDNRASVTYSNSQDKGTFTVNIKDTDDYYYRLYSKDQGAVNEFLYKRAQNPDWYITNNSAVSEATREKFGLTDWTESARTLEFNSSNVTSQISAVNYRDYDSATGELVFKNLPTGSYFLYCFKKTGGGSEADRVVLGRCQAFEIDSKNFNWVEVDGGITFPKYLKNDNPVLDGSDDMHDGIGNRAGYTLKYKGGSTAELKTNVVTVEPPKEEFQFTKVWEGDDVTVPTGDIEQAFLNALQLKLDGEVIGSDVTYDHSFTVTKSEDGKRWTIKTPSLPTFEGKKYSLEENLQSLKDSTNDNIKNFFKYYNVSYSNSGDDGDHLKFEGLDTKNYEYHIAVKGENRNAPFVDAYNGHTNLKDYVPELLGTGWISRTKEIKSQKDIDDILKQLPAGNYVLLAQDRNDSYHASKKESRELILADLSSQITDALTDDIGNSKLHKSTIVIPAHTDRKLLSTTSGSGWVATNQDDNNYSQRMFSAKPVYVNNAYKNTPQSATDIYIDLSNFNPAVYYEITWISKQEGYDDSAAKTYQVSALNDVRYSVFKKGYDSDTTYENFLSTTTNGLAGTVESQGEYGLKYDNLTEEQLKTMITSEGSYIVVAKNNTEKEVKFDLYGGFTDGRLVDGGTIYNTKKLYEIKLRKSTVGGQDLAGASFKMRKENDTQNTMDFHSDDGVHFTSPKIEPGEYVLWEHESPRGYKKIEGSIRFELNEEGKIVRSSVEENHNTLVSLDDDDITINVKNDTDLTKLVIKKEWDDNNDTSSRPDGIKVRVLSNESDKNNFDHINISGLSDKDGWFTITADNNWTLSLDNLTKYAYDDQGKARLIEYKVVENTVPGYTQVGETLMVKYAEELMNEGDTYIGSSERNTSADQIKRYYIKNSSSYYADINIHPFVATWIYIQKNGAKKENVYCINFGKKAPGQGDNTYSTNFNKEYVKNIVSLNEVRSYMYSANDYKSFGDEGSESSENLYKRLLKIIHYGYPNNKEFQEKYSLNDGQFQILTASAIFEYTDWYGVYDGIDYKDKSNHLYALENKVGTEIYKKYNFQDSSDAFQILNLPSSVKLRDIYKEFMKIVDDDDFSMVEGKQLYIYTPKNNADKADYQNLLGVGNIDNYATIKNRKNGDVVFRKTDEEGNPINHDAEDKDAKFKLVPWASDNESKDTIIAKEAVRESTYDENSKDDVYRFEKIPAGIYWLVETKSPKYYSLGDPVKVSIQYNSMGVPELTFFGDDIGKNVFLPENSYNSFVVKTGNNLTQLTSAGTTSNMSAYCLNATKSAPNGEQTYTSGAMDTQMLFNILDSENVRNNEDLNDGDAYKTLLPMIYFGYGGPGYDDFIEEVKADSRTNEGTSGINSSSNWLDKAYCATQAAIWDYTNTNWQINETAYKAVSWGTNQPNKEVFRELLGKKTYEDVLEHIEKTNDSLKGKTITLNILKPEDDSYQYMITYGTTTFSDYQFGYYNELVKVELPNTGGSGTLWIFLIGAGAVAAAITGLAVRSRRKKNIDDNVA